MKQIKRKIILASVTVSTGHFCFALAPVNGESGYLLLFANATNIPFHDSLYATNLCGFAFSAIIFGVLLLLLILWGHEYLATATLSIRWLNELKECHV